MNVNNWAGGQETGALHTSKAILRWCASRAFALLDFLLDIHITERLPAPHRDFYLFLALLIAQVYTALIVVAGV